MKYIPILILITSILLAINFGYTVLHSYEINTIDTQVSNSISDSKKNGLFKKAYLTDYRKGDLYINESWIEHVWKNEISTGSNNKKKLKGLQLVINIENLNSIGYKQNTFLSDWDIFLDKPVLQGGGSSNGFYIFYLKDDVVPDSIQVVVKDIEINQVLRDTIIFKLVGKAE